MGQELAVTIIVIIYSVYVTNSDFGVATFAEENHSGNACGYNDADHISFPYNYAAVDGALWNEGYQCGACYQITCIGSHPSENKECGCTQTPTLNIQIIDHCGTSASDTDFVLNKGAKEKISTCNTTLIDYTRIPCKYSSNIKIRSKLGTPQWFELHIDNVAGRGAINKLEIKSSDDMEWISCSKSNGPSFWLCNNGEPLSNPALPFDVKFTDDQDNELIAYGAITEFAEHTTFDSGVQYDAHKMYTRRRLREARKNENECAARRCCNIRDNIKESDIPNNLNCNTLSDEECGEMDEFCEWDCFPPKHKPKKRKFRRTYRGISLQKGKYKEPDVNGKNAKKKMMDPFEKCMSEGKLISIDDCGVEYEQEMDPNIKEIFCKNHETKQMSKGGDKKRRLYDAEEPLGILEPNVVTPPDERAQVLVNTYPYNTVLYLNFDTLEGTSRCTASMIAPGFALTAAHCIWGGGEYGESETGDYYTNFRLYKNVLSCADKYIYEYGWLTVTIFTAYTSDPGPEHDIGIIQLDTDPGVGHLGFGYTEGEWQADLNIISYPSDMEDCTKWHQFCSWDTLTDFTVISTDCDTAGGASGSPVYVYDAAEDTRAAVAVYTAHYEEEPINIATRITAGKFNGICDTIEEHIPGHCGRDTTMDYLDEMYEYMYDG